MAKTRPELLPTNNHKINYDLSKLTTNSNGPQREEALQNLNQPDARRPQKKFLDVKRKPVSAYKQPQQVANRRDIDMLFEDMDPSEFNVLVESGNINKVIEMRKRKKQEEAANSILIRNKRVKTEEGSTERPAQAVSDPTEEMFIKKAMQQALEFEYSLQSVRQNRVNFARTSLNNAIMRPAIGTSGYGRFLCSHYNPGTSFISYLNGLSHKIGRKAREKELNQREEQERQAKIEQEKFKNEEELQNQMSQKDEENVSLKNCEAGSAKKEENKEGKDTDMKDDEQNTKIIEDNKDSLLSKLKNELEFAHPDQITPKKDRNQSAENSLLEEKKRENSESKNSYGRY